MTNLTQVAYYTRKIAKISALLIGILLVGRVALKIGTTFWRQTHPEPPPPPTVGFGKIPPPIFPLTNGESNLSYKLEIKEGHLPELATTGRVYFIAEKSANLLEFDRARQQARALGFHDEPEKIDEENYRWVNQAAPISTLTLNIRTNHFHFQYDYLNDATITNFKNLPDHQQAIEEAKSFLTSRGLLTKGFENGRSEFEYLALIDGRLQTVSSFSEANFIRVNLFHQDLNQLPVLTSRPQQGPIMFLFSGSREFRQRIIEIDYHPAPIEEEIFETYPLITAKKAWEKLQKGEGFIASMGQNQPGQIIIRWVYLAYYESTQPSLYLQPVVVFQGDRNFFAYVPAVDPQWLE